MWILAILLALILSPAEAKQAHWGNEVFACGSNLFEAQFGDGSDIQLTSIQGNIGAAPLQGVSTWSTNKIRQGLVVIGFNGPHGDILATRPLRALPGYYNNEVDPGLWASVAKIMGLSQVVVPINITFDPPITISGGKLLLKIDVASESQTLTPGQDCLNIETHMTVQWK